MRQALAGAVPLLLLSVGARPAFAHASDRAFVLTLPSDLYILGGTLTVGATFLLVALVPVANLRAVEGLIWRWGRFPRWIVAAASPICFLVMTILILAGWFGTQDPLANPLPLTIWTLWWIGLTVLHALFGDLWHALNPWRWISTLASRRGRPRLRYPAWLGSWPAIAQFLAFVWFQLVYVAPQAPEILANAVALYFLANLAGVLLFGAPAWLGRAEAFSVFFRLVAWLSPFNGRPDGPERPEPTPLNERLVVTLPGLGLLRLRPLTFSATAFVLLVLASLSFEGFAITFRWLAWIGVNPLDFPGRSAVVTANSLGLIGAFALWLACYIATVWLGNRLAGGRTALTEDLGSYVVAIVPIALGYHFAHYLTAFLVDLQYAAITFDDPFGRGWSLFGLAEAEVTTSFLSDYHAVRLIWHCQVAGIVLAHVAAVLVAHVIALRQTGSRHGALLSQAPMTALMIGYTLFGLWLLSTPAIG